MTDIGLVDNQIPQACLVAFRGMVLSAGELEIEHCDHRGGDNWDYGLCLEC